MNQRVEGRKVLYMQGVLRMHIKSGLTTPMDYISAAREMGTVLKRTYGPSSGRRPKMRKRPIDKDNLCHRVGRNTHIEYRRGLIRKYIQDAPKLNWKICLADHCGLQRVKWTMGQFKEAQSLLDQWMSYLQEYTPAAHAQLLVKFGQQDKAAQGYASKDTPLITRAMQKAAQGKRTPKDNTPIGKRAMQQAAQGRTVPA